MSRSQHVDAQHSDPEIASLFQRVLSKNEHSEVHVGYYVKTGVLMRKWRAPDVRYKQDWSVSHQIVVPKSNRENILSSAHYTPMSGHLSIKLFYYRFWIIFCLGLKSDVTQYCNSCHTVGNSTVTSHFCNWSIFSWIFIDCLGPLPKTRSGNEYILTIMCVSYRFPQAIPFRDIKAKKICNLSIFSLCRSSKICTDRPGFEFHVSCIPQVIHELGIKKSRSSAYPPESKCALERFHEILKNMITTYCFDTERNWDEGIHLLLFVVRVCTRFSRFQSIWTVWIHSSRTFENVERESLVWRKFTCKFIEVCLTL
jgi:hypothetical protein